MPAGSPANNTHFVDFEHSPLRLDLNLLSLLDPIDEMAPPLTDGLMNRVSDVRGEFAKYKGQYEAIMAEVAPTKAAVGHWVVSPTRDVRPDDVGQPDNNGGSGHCDKSWLQGACGRRHRRRLWRSFCPCGGGRPQR